MIGIIEHCKITNKTHNFQSPVLRVAIFILVTSGPFFLVLLIYRIRYLIIAVDVIHKHRDEESVMYSCLLKKKKQQQKIIRISSLQSLDASFLHFSGDYKALLW